MSFFQPGPSESSGTTATTLSPAQQAMQEWKVKLLAQLLNARGGGGTTFKSFVNGGPATSAIPGGLGTGSADVLAAMMQPGAFTTTSTANKTEQGPTPSTFSDLTQLGLLGALLYKSGALGALGNGVGGLFGLKPFEDTGAVSGASGGTSDSLGTSQGTTTGDKALDALIGSQYGTNNSMIPGGDATLLPADYPGLNDSGLWQSIMSYL